MPTMIEIDDPLPDLSLLRKKDTPDDPTPTWVKDEMDLDTRIFEAKYAKDGTASLSKWHLSVERSAHPDAQKTLSDFYWIDAPNMHHGTIMTELFLNEIVDFRRSIGLENESYPESSLTDYFRSKTTDFQGDRMRDQTIAYNISRNLEANRNGPTEPPPFNPNAVQEAVPCRISAPQPQNHPAQGEPSERAAQPENNAPAVHGYQINGNPRHRVATPPNLDDYLKPVGWQPVRMPENGMFEKEQLSEDDVALQELEEQHEMHDYLLQRRCRLEEEFDRNHNS